MGLSAHVKKYLVQISHLQVSNLRPSCTHSSLLYRKASSLCRLLTVILSLRLARLVAILSILPAFCSSLTTANTTDDTYDYVVVGSGPGGGVVASDLALAGYTVKLIKAGLDASDDFHTYITELEYPEDDEIKWSFFVNTTTNTTQQLRNRLLTWTLPNGTYWVGSGDLAPRGRNVEWFLLSTWCYAGWQCCRECDGSGHA